VKKQMNSTGREPNMRIVDNYIKAFYVPETELLHWTMTHPEYTRAQIIALINQISSAYNWPRRRRTDLLAQIEVTSHVHMAKLRLQILLLQMILGFMFFLVMLAHLTLANETRLHVLFDISV
jgi:hypothetical protein